MNQPGHVPMLVWHDESDSFECNGSIPGISVVNSLSKTFPTTGRWAGGMILRLYNGIGVGIAFTKQQVKKLLGNHTFEHATRMYESPKGLMCGSQLPPPQRREAKSAKLQTTRSQQNKRKADSLRAQSHNVAHIERVKGSHALCCSKRKKFKTTKKLTFTEAATEVIKHAKSPSFAPCTNDNNVHSESGGFVAVSEDLKSFYTLNPDGVVESWSGPLVVFDMTGWQQVKGGFIRPRPKCPHQGLAIRESSTKFEWLPGMKDLVREKLKKHTASSAPCESIANAVAMDGRWSDLECPTKSQIKNFAMSHFSKKKKAAQHALDRQGKRCYVSFSFAWLKKEVEHRGMRVGNRKATGYIKLLENHDDENEGKLTKFHSVKDVHSEQTTSSRLGLTAFKKAIQSRPTNVPWMEWYQKECVYQHIEISARLREPGMCKLLHKHYLEQDTIVKRHDDDHTADDPPAHSLGDKVEVFWHAKWYPATVIKCYPNNTWDVKYPPPADQVYCSRLPAGLLRKTNSSNT